MAAGPTNLQEVLHVLRPLVTGVASRVQAILGTKFASVGNSKWEKVVVTTSYSGMDFPGIALGLLKQYFAELQIDFKYELYAATDIDPACKKALLAKHVPPQHVFHSLLDRLPDAMADFLQAEAQKHRTHISNEIDRLAADLDKRATRRQLIEERSALYVRTVQLHLARVDMSQFENSWCWSCQQVCSARPKREPGCLYIEIAGSTCVAYSNMSTTRWGLLDDSALPFLVWLYWARHCKFDIVLHECVPSVPLAQADRIMQLGEASLLVGLDTLATEDQLYGPVRSVVNSPTDFGVPCARRRRFSMWVLKSWLNRLHALGPAQVSPCADNEPVKQQSSSSSRPHALSLAEAAPCADNESGKQQNSSSEVGPRQEPTQQGHLEFSQDAMCLMFYRRLSVSKDTYLVATPEQVQQYYQRRATNRGNLQSHGPFDLSTLISPCARVHLQAAQHILEQLNKVGSPTKPDIICLMQSPFQVTPDRSDAFPTLLTGALPYSLAAGRLVLPEELLLTMGVPAPLLMEVLPDSTLLHPYVQPLTEVLTEREFRRMVGNGMHVCQIGSCILLALCEAMLRQ